MFQVYVREDVPGGEVLFNEDRDSADAAEAAAFQMIARICRDENYAVTVKVDGALGDGIEEGWGGEIVLSCDMWADDYRLVLETED